MRDFEEMADIMQWNNIEQQVYGKRALTGTALLFLRSEAGITSWRILKRKLLEEFGEAVNSATIHKTLATTKKRSEKTLQQYLLRMKEIAVQGDVEEGSLVDYIINGIPDDPSSKTILYGATTLSELKERFRSYLKYKSNFQSGKSEMKLRKESSVAPANRTSERCFNCGYLGYRSRDCKNRSADTRCFACNKFSHLSSNCPEKERVAREEHGVEELKISKAAYQVCASKNSAIPRLQKQVKINQYDVTAFFDTGSDLNCSKGLFGYRSTKLCRRCYKNRWNRRLSRYIGQI